MLNVGWRKRLALAGALAAAVLVAALVVARLSSHGTNHASVSKSPGGKQPLVDEPISVPPIDRADEVRRDTGDGQRSPQVGLREGGRREAVARLVVPSLPPAGEMTREIWFRFVNDPLAQEAAVAGRVAESRGEQIVFCDGGVDWAEYDGMLIAGDGATTLTGSSRGAYVQVQDSVGSGLLLGASRWAEFSWNTEQCVVVEIPTVVVVVELGASAPAGHRTILVVDDLVTVTTLVAPGHTEVRVPSGEVSLGVAILGSGDYLLGPSTVVLAQGDMVVQLEMP